MTARLIHWPNPFPISPLVTSASDLPWPSESFHRCILPARAGTMLRQVNQTEARDLEWSCQAVSPMDEPCDSTASFHCGICGRWFCPAHAEDENWHTCFLEPGDEGGEA